MFLEGLWSSGRRALRPAALSLFLAESSTVPHRPGQHPRYVNSDVVLFGTAACMFPLGRISCSSRPVLPRPTGRPSVHWFLHLRRFMRLLLFCGINLLCSYPRKRTFLPSAAISSISGAIYLCVKLQGDGGYPPGDRFDL